MVDVIFSEVLCFMNKNVQRFDKSTLLDIASKFYHDDELYDAKGELCKTVSALQPDVAPPDGWSKFVNSKGVPVVRRTSDSVHRRRAESVRARLTVEKIWRDGRELLQHPPYSPHLAPSDFHLLGQQKECLGGIKFDNNEDVQQHVLQFLWAADKDFYGAGFSRLVDRWERCIELQGDYVEK